MFNNFVVFLYQLSPNKTQSQTPLYLSQNQTQTPSYHSQNQTLDDSNDEIIHKTQPTSASPCCKGKQSVENKNKEKPYLWTPIEELQLTQSWVDISEESKQGNAQEHDHLWLSIVVRFRKELGEGDDYHTKHLINSMKQETMRCVLKMNQLYNNLKTKG